MATQDGLVLDLHPREHSVELALVGDLDMASAPRLRAALVWLRRRYPRVIVVDTRGLDFVDLAGLRALELGSRHADGSLDPLTIHVVGDAVARLQQRLAAARRDHPSSDRRAAAHG